MSPHSILLPALGESVTEGTITRWLKQVGDAVAEGEPLVEVSTDKVDTEIVSTASGVLESILVAENETVDVGTEIATVSGGGTSQPLQPEVIVAITSPSPARPSNHGPAVAHAAVLERRQQDFLSPLVRALSVQNGIDPARVTGTGRDGRVSRADMLAALAKRGQAGETGMLRGTSVPMSRLRKVLAARAVESMAGTAQLTTVVEVDVTNIDLQRRASKDAFARRTGISLSFLPYFAVAAVGALREFPVINARIEGDSIVYPEAEHVNFAVDTDRGLLSPVVNNAGQLDVEGFALAIADVAARSRANSLRPDELSGGTFTITNTGARGALFDTPVVFLPQVAILGTGIVTRRPVVVNRNGEELIAIRSMVYLALSYDHRAVDGADAAGYLAAVKSRLEVADFALASS